MNLIKHRIVVGEMIYRGGLSIDGKVEDKKIEGGNGRRQGRILIPKEVRKLQRA